MSKNENSRIGVFLCHCGGNISDTIDLEEVEKRLLDNPDVISVKHHENLCSQEGNQIINTKKPPRSSRNSSMF